MNLGMSHTTTDIDIHSRLVTIDRLPFPQLDTSRRIRVLLPETYSQSEKRYPVIYFHDGQNAFFDQDAKYGTSWRVQDELAKLYRDNESMEFILVAIDNSPLFDFNGRFNEYSPWKMDDSFQLPSRDKGIYQLGGHGAAYAEFVAHDVRYYIESHFRTLNDRSNRLVMGSSMGGLISLYIAMQYNDIFGSSGVFSPAFWFNKPACLQWLKGIELSQPLKLYMDVGTNETSDEAREDFNQIYVDDTKVVARLVERMDNVSLNCQVFQGDIHNERAWQRRFPNFVSHCW
jgi:predicted alpha/beta superfamily hydrolase